MKWIQYGRQGWVRVHGVEGTEILAKTVDFKGRRVVTDLVFSTNPWPPGVSASLLKSTPVGWIETMINTPEARRLLDEQQEAEPPAAMHAKADPTDNALQDRLDDSFYVELPFATEREDRLTRPDGSDPDAFYRQVAEAYNAAVTKSSKVAPVLAEEAGVPVPTVHRWIAEARRRGHLPPAKRGRAG